MPDVSVIIPARAEQFLAQTVESIAAARRGDTEIIAVIDGEEAGPPVPELPGVRVIRHTEPIGQRASVNEAARESTAQYILKTDGHSMLDEGFDLKLMAHCEYDWTVIPTMYNLHAYNLRCKGCGEIYYNRGEHRPCPTCKKTAWSTEMIWQPNWKKRTDWMYFRSPVCQDRPLRVQYWGGRDHVCDKCGGRHDAVPDNGRCDHCGHVTFHKETSFSAEYKAHKRWSRLQGDIADVMTGQGACWFQHRARFLELGGLDESHGSWGQVGVEVACKAWLSGGRHVVNRTTWFAHLFRCGDGASFPYKIRASDQEKARQYSIDLWMSGRWDKQVRPIQWLIEHFWPVPTWPKPETIPELRDYNDARDVAYNGRRDRDHAKIEQLAAERAQEVTTMKDTKSTKASAETVMSDKPPSSDIVIPRDIAEMFCGTTSKTQTTGERQSTHSYSWSQWPPTMQDWLRNGLDPKDFPSSEERRATSEAPTVSVLIPARNEPFLAATVKDLLKNLHLNCEIIIGLDGPDQSVELFGDERVRVVRNEQALGMRPTLNRLLAKARGRYILKCDAHVAIAEGLDKALVDAWEPGCAVVATRYDLDTKRWVKREHSKTDVRRLTHVSEDEIGLRSMAWPEYEQAHAAEPIMETMTCSGSLWLIERELWQHWGGWDERHGHFGQEGCELACKVWLSGGRLLHVTTSWYAHHNRGKATYAMGANVKPKSIAHSHDLWLNDKWRFQKYSFNWLLEKFQPPGWPQPDYGPTIRAIHHGGHCKAFRTSVAELWAARHNISEPLKAHRLDIFWSAFGEFVDSVLAGTPNYEGRYQQYLISHLRRGAVAIPTKRDLRAVRRKMGKAARLVLDIRDQGLKSPLEFYCEDGRMILWKGYRRLVILQRLGIIKGKRAIGRSIADRQAAESLSPQDHLMRLQPAGPGDVTRLAQQQYVEHGGDATDKYWVHQYTAYYDHHFAPIRKRARKVCEVGLAKGASLKLWRDYFPKAKIVGFDCEPDRWKKYAGELPDTKIIVGDETKIEDVERLISAGPFDVIVDDASHDPADQEGLFDRLWPSVRPFGWYVIEDIHRNFNPQDADHCCLPDGLHWDIYLARDVREVHWYYNIVFIQKAPAPRDTKNEIRDTPCPM